MIAGGAISMLGFLSGDTLGSPRNLFAFARDGLLPSPLARLHPRFRTPAAAIVVHAALVWVAAVVGSFGVLALVSNVALLTAYLMCCVSAIELARRDVRAGGTPFVVPGGPVVPVAACIVLVWLLAQATSREWAMTAATVAVAAVLYAWRAARRRNQTHAASTAS